MKCYQLVKFCKRFYKEREKTLIKQSIIENNTKTIIEKSGKVGLCFVTG